MHGVILIEWRATESIRLHRSQTTTTAPPAMSTGGRSHAHHLSCIVARLTCSRSINYAPGSRYVSESWLAFHPFISFLSCQTATANYRNVGGRHSGWVLRRQWM